ncbi:hypothetical protein CPB85DRAFT_1304582 [Mucidula mucida]|nr:hypothetical protein CPB85DRAFT_1304582 [Mucidula mucida]
MIPIFPHSSKYLNSLIGTPDDLTALLSFPLPAVRSFSHSYPSFPKCINSKIFDSKTCVSTRTIPQVVERLTRFERILCRAHQSTSTSRTAPSPCQHLTRFYKSDPMDVLQENLYDSDEDSDEDDTWTESEVDKPFLWVSELHLTSSGSHGRSMSMLLDFLGNEEWSPLERVDSMHLNARGSTMTATIVTKLNKLIRRFKLGLHFHKLRDWYNASTKCRRAENCGYVSED